MHNAGRTIGSLLQGEGMLYYARLSRFYKISLTLEAMRFDSNKCHVVMKFDRRLRSTTAEPPDKFQSHPLTLNTNLVPPSFDEIWQIWGCFSVVKWVTGPNGITASIK